jgi:site-specific recombinase XerD
MDFDTAILRYLRHQRVAGRSKWTEEWHRISLRQFKVFLAGEGHSLQVEDLCADDLRAWIESLRDKGLAQNSIATKSRSPKAWGKWLLEEEYVSKHPFIRVGMPSREDIAKAIFTPAEIESLLKDCDRSTWLGLRDYAIQVLLYSTGIRASELLALTQEDIDRTRQLVTIKKGKGGKFRRVPLSRPVERALDKYLAHPKRPKGDHLFVVCKGRPMGLDALEMMMKRRSGRTGIHANPHKYRHSCAVQYLRNGGRVEVLRTMLGHSKLEMTLHYARIAGVDLTEAHDHADPLRALRVRV